MQRAHQNTLEGMPLVNISVAMAGLVYPITAAVCGGIWCLGRFLYIHGYSQGDPDKRFVGALISHLGDLPILFVVFGAGAKMLGYA